MEILDYEDASEALECPIETNINASSTLAYEFDDWECVGSIYIRDGRSVYGFDNQGSITMYNEDLGLRRIPTSQERDVIETTEFPAYVAI